MDYYNMLRYGIVPTHKCFNCGEPIHVNWFAERDGSIRSVYIGQDPVGFAHTKCPNGTRAEQATALREKLAKLAHEQWAGWMHWIFQYGTDNKDGTFTIEAEHVARWKKQMRTPYEELDESEKELDRIEADKVLVAIGKKFPKMDFRQGG